MSNKLGAAIVVFLFVSLPLGFSEAQVNHWIGGLSAALLMLAILMALGWLLFIRRFFPDRYSEHNVTTVIFPLLSWMAGATTTISSGSTIGVLIVAVTATALVMSAGFYLAPSDRSVRGQNSDFAD